jgi:hypothetical protein
LAHTERRGSRRGMRRPTTSLFGSRRLHAGGHGKHFVTIVFIDFESRRFVTRSLNPFAHELSLSANHAATGHDKFLNDFALSSPVGAVEEVDDGTDVAGDEFEAVAD